MGLNMGASLERSLRAGMRGISRQRSIFPSSRRNPDPGQKMTIPCGRAIANKLENMETPEIHAEMFIVVTYRPKWLLWYKSEKFPMKTEKTDNGYGKASRDEV
jgi:hypothetical protein